QFSRLKADRVLCVRRGHVVHIGAEGEDLPFPASLALHFHRDKRHALDFDGHFLDWRDEVIASVILKPEHGSEQLDERQPLDRAAPVIPRPVTGDFEPDIPAKINVSQWSGTALCREPFQMLRERLFRPGQACFRPPSTANPRATGPWWNLPGPNRI